MKLAYEGTSGTEGDNGDELRIMFNDCGGVDGCVDDGWVDGKKLMEVRLGVDGEICGVPFVTVLLAPITTGAKIASWQ